MLVPRDQQGQDSSRTQELAVTRAKHTRPECPRTRQDRRGQSPSAPVPQGPASSGKENGSETHREAGQGKRRRHQRPGPQGQGPDTSPSPETAAPARRGLVGTDPRRDHTKSRAMSSFQDGRGAASRPRNLLENREERGGGRQETGQLSLSGAWRPVWRAGPEGEPDSPQLPLLRLRLAAAGAGPPSSAAVLQTHWWLR